MLVHYLTHTLKDEIHMSAANSQSTSHYTL